jgi:hypothetical protein
LRVLTSAKDANARRPEETPLDQHCGR